MKNKFKYIAIFFIIIVSVCIFLFMSKFKKNDLELSDSNKIENENEFEDTAKIESENKTFIIEIDKNTTDENNVVKKEEKKEETLDASTLTQNIYNLNMEIGTLYIPKTGLTSSIYSNSSVNMMEKMPCFLYTTGGLNKKGITLFVGHNRRNGKIFSENKKLEVGDIFYFKDYEGTDLEYTIYDKFITDSGDISFLSNEVDSPVIALSCCTDASDENRIIILGRAN